MLRDHLSVHHVAWSRRFPQRRFTRYFTIFISTSLVLFILFLVNASRISQAEVQAGAQIIAEPTPEWEQFPLLQRYFGGIRSLIDRSGNEIEYPLSEDEEASRLAEAAMQRKANDEIRAQANSRRDTWMARSTRFDPFASLEERRKPVTCYLDAETNLTAPKLLAYSGVPSGMPNPVMGNYDTLGLRDDVCFDRYGRLGPYGYGYSRTFGGSSTGLTGDTLDKNAVWDNELEVDWRVVNWADAQDDCIAANAHRFKPFHTTKDSDRWSSMKKRDEAESHLHQDEPQAVNVPQPESDETTSHTGDQSQSKQEDNTSHGVDKLLLPRTAVLIRTWDDYVYDDEDMFNLRALINELSLESGGEYVVHFLVHVKNETEQIFADESIYQRVLRASLPDEFSGMGTLWSEKQMSLIYSGLDETLYRDLGVHGVYRSSFMPVQYFAHMHPEYDFFWNWEMDIRYTGHFYHLFDRASQWSKEQPRKGLWERNGRFYVPSKHGSYEDFRQMVRVQIEHGTASKSSIYNKIISDAHAAAPNDEKLSKFERPVWGPLTSEHDTFDGSHDPVPPTSYDKDNYVWGTGEDADLITFNPIFDPQSTSWILAGDVSGYNSTLEALPRRASIGTAVRLSRRLLNTMHRETALERRTMFSEMWPATCALHHGFKAVYVPHPIYVDRAWPTSYLAAVFNNGHNGASGGSRTSVFSDKRQHNFKGTTWYYDAVFGAKLWQRWLGYKVEEEGGEQFEVSGEGRMCLPAMLLHPVKQIDLIVELQPQVEEVVHEVD